MIGYQIRYWKRDSLPGLYGVRWANGTASMLSSVNDLAACGVIRFEILADDGTGNVVIGTHGVNAKVSDHAGV